MADQKEIQNVPRGEDRLDSWKRIAAYLQRGVRTVRRWEAEEGLPVHRHPHKRQGSVYAYKTEIDDWLDNRSSKGAVASGPIAMLAVLPFDNLSNDTEQDYFSDGLTEEVISQLGSLQRTQLGVIARTSVVGYKGTTKSIREIGKDLGVAYILEGSVRRQGERVRITAQLIQVSDQTHIWAHSFEQTMDDILQLQSQLALAVSEKISAVLNIGETEKPRRLPSRSPGIPPSHYETYLKARYLLYRMTPESIAESMNCFRQVIDAEPDYAAAYAGLAEALQLITIFGAAPPLTTMPNALDAVTRAISMDPGSAEAHAAAGHVHACYSWDWTAADNAFRKAVELNPSLVTAHQWYAEYLAVVSRFDEAHDHVRRARELDPLSLAAACSHGHVLWLEGHGEPLIESMNHVVEMEPRYPLAHILLGLGHAILRQYDKAEDVFRNATEICGMTEAFAGLTGYAAAIAGREEVALQQLKSIEQGATEHYVTRFFNSVVCVGLGLHDETMDHLEAAYAERSWHMSTLGTNFMFQPLHGEARFQVLLDKLKYPGQRARIDEKLQ